MDEKEFKEKAAELFQSAVVTAEAKQAAEKAEHARLKSLCKDTIHPILESVTKIEPKLKLAVRLTDDAPNETVAITLSAPASVYTKELLLQFTLKHGAPGIGLMSRVGSGGTQSNDPPIPMKDLEVMTGKIRDVVLAKLAMARVA